MSRELVSLDVKPYPFQAGCSDGMGAAAEGQRVGDGRAWGWGASPLCDLDFQPPPPRTGGIPEVFGHLPSSPAWSPSSQIFSPWLIQTAKGRNPLPHGTMQSAEETSSVFKDFWTPKSKALVLGFSGTQASWADNSDAGRSSVKDTSRSAAPGIQAPRSGPGK